MPDPQAMRDLFGALRSNFDDMVALFDTFFPVPQEQWDGTLRVRVGDDVQAAFDALLPTGGTLALQPGIHLVDLVVPERQVTDPLITVTSDASGLASPGQRITPDFLPGLGMLQNVNTSNNTIKGLNRSRNVAFVNMAISRQGDFSRAHVAIGGDRTETPTPSDLPSGWLFDRVYAFGDPLLGGHRGIQMHCDGLTVINSHISDMFEVGRDSQAVSSWNGGRNLLLENNYLEASGENVMFGGDESAAPEMTTQDVIMRRCQLAKNLAWMDLARQPTIKTLLEIKNGKRILADGCIFEKNWARDWPTGVALMIKACNGSDPAAREVWATAEDVTIQDSLIRDVGSVFGLVGYGDAKRVSDRARRITLRNILAMRINQGDYKGTGHGCAIANPPDGLTIDHLTMVKNSHSWMNTWFDQGQAPGERLTYTNNVACNSSYGYQTPTNGLGVAAIAKDWQAATLAGNTFQAGSRSLGTLPPGNAVVSVADFDGSLDAQCRVKPGSVIAGIVTTDGLAPGADVDTILAKTGTAVP